VIALAVAVAAGTLAVGLAATFALRLLPSVRLQLAGLAFLSVVLPLLAVLLSGWVMFHMGDDVKILAVAAPSATAAVVAALLLGSSITRRIETLRSASAALAAGDLGSRAPDGGPRELAELGGSFNAMADSLEGLFDARRELVAAASHDLRAPVASIAAMLEAIEDGDNALLREELGDVLLQVAFHARLAEELAEDERWSVDDVAGDLVAKLVRRHPHVFADREVSGAAEVEANWDVIKAVEKRRSSVTDGVPLGQPALTLAAALLSRVDKAGLPLRAPAGDEIGHRLFALVAEARAAGVDPEAALRAVARDFRDAVADLERRSGDPLPPS